jgi:hypothetical protein
MSIRNASQDRIGISGIRFEDKRIFSHAALDSEVLKESVFAHNLSGCNHLQLVGDCETRRYQTYHHHVVLMLRTHGHNASLL